MNSVVPAENSDSCSAESKSIVLSVVMPCLNEEKTLPNCIDKATRTMQGLGIDGEVLVVDNGSSDRSVEVANEHGARVVHQSVRGYGNALRKGFDEARGRFIIMGDCDESYDFGDLERFLTRLQDGADLVMGNRLTGEVKRGAMPWLHRWIGNPFLSRFLNVLFRTGVGDAHCGMRGFTKEAYQQMSLRMPGMEMASEMVIKSKLAGLRIEEIPITLWPDGRDRPPHLRSFRDGWRHLRFMIMCCPVFLFFLPGLLLSAAGLAAIPAAVLAGYGVYTDSFGPNFMYSASLLSITGIHLMVFGFLAKIYTHLVDPVFEDPRVGKLLSWFSIERGLIIGIVLLVIAAATGLPVLYHWSRTREVLSPAQWILAGTLFVHGIEVVFATFLVGILELPHETRRTG